MELGIAWEVIRATKRLRSVKKLKNVVYTVHGSEAGKETERLGELLLDVADETLKRLFKDGTDAIYHYLEKQHHFKREEIAEKPEVFSAGLRRILGSSAKVVEKFILKNLYHKLELEFEERGGYMLSDYIKELKEKV